MKCKECGYEIRKSEWYVELENGDALDETCFFNMALEKLKGENKQCQEGSRIIKNH